MSACLVAKFYGLDPSIVENWPNPEYLDREEYMYIQMEVDEQEMDNSRKASR